MHADVRIESAILDWQFAIAFQDEVQQQRRETVSGKNETII